MRDQLAYLRGYVDALRGNPFGASAYKPTWGTSFTACAHTDRHDAGDHFACLDCGVRLAKA